MEGDRYRNLREMKVDGRRRDGMDSGTRIFSDSMCSVVTCGSVSEFTMNRVEFIMNRHEHILRCGISL